ncbi:Hypp7715 [Branchiostoma lanceolatum]|uniref:Hypp7715 protein n=1 Tax=Branchiostoma lanceolatum TaxID=7740 RepID=A0A8K0EEV8_BRALA|nr:Hypp7715 [Branchiostoma lanceolatum]
MLSLHSVPGRAAGTPRGRLTSRFTTETEQSGNYPREHARHVILAREESPTVYELARGRRGWARGTDADDRVTAELPTQTYTTRYKPDEGAGFGDRHNNALRRRGTPVLVSREVAQDGEVTAVPSDGRFRTALQFVAQKKKKKLAGPRLDRDSIAAVKN